MVTVKSNMVENITITLTNFEARTLFEYLQGTTDKEDLDNMGDKKGPIISDIHGALREVFK